jgi:hypothetical protein
MRLDAKSAILFDRRDVITAGHAIDVFCNLTIIACGLIIAWEGTISKQKTTWTCVRSYRYINRLTCVYYSRHFFLTLFFLMMGCWYGVSLVFWPFYEPLRAQVKEHGFRWFYSNGTGFLDLPKPLALLNMFRSGKVPAKVVIDIVYPLLLGVGAILSGFFGYHVKYSIMARTTLEHRVILEQSFVSLYHSGSVGATPTNPFDQGWRKNLEQVLGRNFALSFLPLVVEPPPPFVLNGKAKQS